jgi:hypothetical protein
MWGQWVIQNGEQISVVEVGDSFDFVDANGGLAIDGDLSALEELNALRELGTVVWVCVPVPGNEVPQGLGD